MSFVKNNTSISDFDKDKEIIYHKSQIEYHEKCYQDALKEAAIHFEKMEQHQNLLDSLVYGDCHE